MANKKTKTEESNKDELKASAKKAATKTDSSSNKATKSKKDKARAKKPGPFSKVTNYFGAVRTEMHRVVWPTKKELGNYTLAVIVSLIVVGVVIAALDAVIGGGLVALSNLRG